MPSMLLFSGLPLDVRETDLAELLTSDPTRLVASSVAVTALHNSAGAFLGTFLVQVGSETDAEKVRRHYSGQIIDGSHRLAVHHVLQETMPHPSVKAPAAGTAAAGASKPAAAKKVADTKAPGLRLLSRMGKGAGAAAAKTGKADPKQKALLDKQRAAIKKAKNPGDVLLSRLAKGGPKPATKKTAAAAAVKAKVGKGKGVKAAAGKDKVARAKRDSGRMDVDKPAPAPAAAVAKPKTQAQLDEEMKAYERQRRFA